MPLTKRDKIATDILQKTLIIQLVNEIMSFFSINTGTGFFIRFNTLLMKQITMMGTSIKRIIE